MPTQTWYVQNSSDDCTRWWKDGASFGFAKTNDYLFCGDDNTSYYDYSSGIRFTNVTIPQGSTITSAIMALMSGYTSYVIPNTVFEGQDADDADAFTTGADYDARPRTTANVAWTPTAWQSDTYYDTPNLASIIQEIISRPGWTSGSNLVIFWRDAAGYGGTDNDISAYSRDYGLPDRPILEIVWTETAPTTSTVTMVTVGTGTTDPAAGVQVYSYGSNLTVTATAGEGYSFSKMVRTGYGPVTDNPYTFLSLAETETITTTFTEDAIVEVSTVSPTRMSNPQFKVTVT